MNSDDNEWSSCRFSSYSQYGVFIGFRGGEQNYIAGCIFNKISQGSCFVDGLQTGFRAIERSVFNDVNKAITIRHNNLVLRNCAFKGGSLFNSLYNVVTPNADYNIFCGTRLPGNLALRSIQEQQDGWWHCTVAEPGFVDADGGDFHLKSEGGAV